MFSLFDVMFLAAWFNLLNYRLNLSLIWVSSSPFSEFMATVRFYISYFNSHISLVFSRNLRTTSGFIVVRPITLSTLIMIV